MPSNPPPRSVLLLHGLGGGPYELQPLSSALQDAGLTTIAPALPGHDTDGPIMPSSTWEQWKAHAQLEFSKLHERLTPTAIVGFSTGATLALDLAADHPERVSRLVLICPFLAIRHYWFYGWRPEQYLRAPWGQWVEHVPRRPPAARDPEARKQVEKAASTRYRTFNLDATRSALSLIRHVRDRVGRVTSPTLVAQATLDTVVQPEQADWLIQHLGSTRKELVWLERSDHLAAWDLDRALLIGRVLSFLQNDLGA